jgi:hypothetical protein
MANTFELIASVTVSTPQAAIEFTSIPSTYTDLCVKLTTRTSAGSAEDIYIEFNTDSNNSNYTARQIQGAGSGTPVSNTLNRQTATSSGSTDTASTFASSDIYIPNYAGTTTKSASTDSVTENNATTAYASLRATLWNNTTAINAIKFTHASAANFAANSTAYLYGVKNA